MPDKIQKTYQEIGAFDRDARIYLAKKEQEWREKNPESKAAAPHSKFGHALQRMTKRAQTILGRYNEQLEDIAISNASEDKEGNLATDERGQFKFKKEALLKRNEEQRTLFRSETEIEPYFATQIPEDLTDMERDSFVDFVIDPKTVEEKEE